MVFPSNDDQTGTINIYPVGETHRGFVISRRHNMDNNKKVL
jgi:hypothetical protein